ncbi:hydantoinase B/oxoprolinase family protein [Chloroflexota bacterium]
MNSNIKHRVDPVTLSIVLGYLETLTKQMTLVMTSTARSGIFKFAHDYSDVIFDGQCRCLVQGEDDQPIHLGTMATAAEIISQHFGNDIYEGDIIYHNDPATGGAHLQDMMAIAPVFIDNELMFWVANKAHQIDTGGMLAGGYQSLAEEIYQEGIRIPPVKIFEKGRERKDIIDLVMANIRYPLEQRGDLAAQLGACGVAITGLRNLVKKYGKQTIKDCIEDMMDMGERRIRGVITNWPDGVYHGVDYLESIRGSGDLELKVKVTIEGDAMTVEWDTPPVLPAFVNSYPGNTLASVYHQVLVSARLEPPFNAGCYRPIRVNFGPPGTIANAILPAACSNATTTPAQNFLNAMRRALSQVLPKENLNACWGESAGFTSSSVNPSTNKRYTWLHIDAAVSGMGAVWGADGMPWMHTEVGAGAISTPQVEEVENDYPMLITRSEFRADSGGSGKWRGGLGGSYMVEYPNHKQVTIAVMGQGNKFAPCGVLGATNRLLEPKLVRRYVLRDGKKTMLGTGERVILDEGDRFVCEVSGGGGMGNPFERDVDEVRMDVQNEFVSVEGALKDYGVVIEPVTLRVNTEATAKLRKKSSV